MPWGVDPGCWTAHPRGWIWPRAPMGTHGAILAVLGAGRHPRGTPDPVGSIWCYYRAKRSHGDLFQTIFEKTQPETGTEKSGPRLPSVESGPRLSSVESGPRLPSEKSGQVAAAAMVAAAGALAPAGAYGVNAGMARAAKPRACCYSCWSCSSCWRRSYHCCCCCHHCCCHRG